MKAVLSLLMSWRVDNTVSQTYCVILGKTFNFSGPPDPLWAGRKDWL